MGFDVDWYWYEHFAVQATAETKVLPYQYFLVKASVETKVLPLLTLSGKNFC